MLRLSFQFFSGGPVILFSPVLTHCFQDGEEPTGATRVYVGIGNNGQRHQFLGRRLEYAHVFPQSTKIYSQAWVVAVIAVLPGFSTRDNLEHFSRYMNLERCSSVCYCAQFI